MTDPTVFAGAAGLVISALTLSIVTVINTVSKMKQELLAAAAAATAAAEERAKATAMQIAEVKTKVDGNFSDVKAELVIANQRIAVLTERLLTTSLTEKKE